MVAVGIVGTTSWGTTLGVILARRGIDVTLWARSPEEAAMLQQDGEHRRLLPGFQFPDHLRVTASATEALSQVAMVVYAVPSATMRENIQATAGAIGGVPLVVSACKGLERNTGKRMAEVMQDELPERLHRSICVLSGPNLAVEVVGGKPTSTVIASVDEGVAVQAQELFMSDNFRVYTNRDVIGVELAGALKNIIALGAGISDGLKYGDNAKAAFIARGLVEIVRLGMAAGADPLTFAGLAGMGDLVATCFSKLSRNRYVGEELAQGRGLREILASMGHVAEGVDTTVAALAMAERLEVELPITEMTHCVLFDGLDPRQAVAELMARAPRAEWSGLRLQEC